MRPSAPRMHGPKRNRLWNYRWAAPRPLPDSCGEMPVGQANCLSHWRIVAQSWPGRDAGAEDEDRGFKCKLDRGVFLR